MRNRFAGFAGGVILCLLMALPARASYVGEYAVGETAVCGFFNTYQPSTGASFTLASEAVDVYKGSSATQDADDSGLTIDDDFDGVTGFHLVCVDTSADGTFYSAGDNFTVVLTAGTVDSVSVAGTAVLSFSLAQSSSFARLGAPAGASVSADIAAIEGQTDDIGAAGAGLTAIDLPNQTMDIVGSITGNLSGSVGSVTGAVGSVTGAVGSVTGLTASNLDATITSRASQASLDTLDNFVDTEVAAILALLDDARSEPGQGAPPVNPDLATKVDYLYKWTRNKKDNDGAQTQFYADDGTTVDHKQPTTEVAGTVTKGEIVAGP